jgi:iron complex outermembrane receptor protein
MRDSKPMRRAVSALLVSAVANLFLPQHTRADEPVQPRKEHFEIQAQSFAGALQAYARQTGEQVVFFSDLGAGRTVQRISGTYTREQVLERILSNTGLTYQRLNANTIAVGPIGGSGSKQSEPKQSPQSDKETAMSNRYPLLCCSATALAMLSMGPRTAAADDAPNAPQGKLEEVVVSGIRSSLRQALDTKRNAGAVVDAISAEDIGKFPDKNVADALQRVPGISVDRIWGEGRDIFVRGTDNTLNRTLMNGQNVASAYWWANDNPSRGFNYDILASELVSSLEVFKSPEADMDEGSIGGLVNVRTRRPMELKPFTIQASAEALYSVLGHKTDPQASGLFSWHDDDRRFGALVSLSYQKRQMRRDGLEGFTDDTLWDITDQTGKVTRNVHSLWGGGSALFEQDRRRVTENATLQWRPLQAWDITLNYVNSDMHMDNHNENYLYLPGGYLLPASTKVTNPVFIPTSDGHQALVGGTLGDGTTTGASIEAIYRQAFIKSRVADLDTTFSSDHWTLHGQAGKTHAEGGSNHDQNYWFQGNTRETLALGPRQIDVSYLDLDPTNGAALHFVPGNERDWIRIMKEDETYAQGDLTFDLDSGFFKSFKTGIKYRDDTVENTRQIGKVSPNNPNLAALTAITLNQVSNGTSPALSQQAATQGSVTRYALVDGGLAQAVINPLLDLQYSLDPLAYYKIEEHITALYAKLAFELGALHGNIGVRGIHTKQESTAYIGNDLATVTRPYNNVLPSINAVYQLRDDLLLRGSVSKAMARDTFQNLSSNITINATTGSASAGNPFLKPIKANQFEVGSEWYFADASLLSGTYFWKSLDTFVYNLTDSEIINNNKLVVTRPFNSDHGAKIQGVELQWQQALWAGFGIVTNYTFTNASVDPIPGQPRVQLQGNSKHQLNTSLYFETPRFSARVSYNYRSEAFGALTMGSQVVTDAYHQIDATASWNVTHDLAIYANAVNITNEIIYQHTADGIPVGFYENGPRYSIGARFKF